MKKIDILNFITNFRKSPNDMKTHSQLLAHIGSDHADKLDVMLNELKQTKVLRETEANGEKVYQVVTK